MNFLKQIVIFILVLLIAVASVYSAGWQSTPPKRDMYDVEVQLCIKPSQCLVTSSGKLDYDDDPEKYFASKGIFTERPRCLADGQYVEDYYCAAGDWTSRTRLLSDAIYGVALNRNHGENNFTMICGPYDSVLNDFTTGYGDVVSFLDKNSGQCSQYAGCVNNVCVLKFPKGIVLGTSLNIPINDSSSFLVALNFSQLACNNIPKPPSGTFIPYGSLHSNFAECSGTPVNTTYYDSELNSLVYDPAGLRVFRAPIQDFHNNVIKPVFLNDIYNYTFTFAHDTNAPALGRDFSGFKPRYFRSLFFDVHGDSSLHYTSPSLKMIYSFFEDVPYNQQNAMDYFGLKTQNITWPQGICSVIKNSDQRAVIYCDNNTDPIDYFIVGKKSSQRQLFDVWQGLTKLLRIT